MRETLLCQSVSSLSSHSAESASSLLSLPTLPRGQEITEGFLQAGPSCRQGTFLESS